MKRILFIGLFLLFFAKLDADTHLRDIPDVMEETVGTCTSYKLGDTCVWFPANGQQPEDVELTFYLCYCLPKKN